jgi:hypothetical protein
LAGVHHVNARTTAEDLVLLIRRLAVAARNTDPIFVALLLSASLIVFGYQDLAKAKQREEEGPRKWSERHGG